MASRVVWIVILVSIWVSQARGQSADLEASASDAWNRREWTRAAEAYASLARTDTTRPLLNIRLGAALTALGRYGEAREQLKLAERRGGPVAQVAFRMALAEAGSGRIDSAFAQLKRATDAGLRVLPVPGDSLSAMSVLKREQRFAAFLTDMDRNARPCMYNPKHNEFDFWLGTWDVRPNGQPGNPPATNVITKIDDGCVVHESWTAPGSVGQSFNIYDRTRQKWFQIWVDNSGGLHEYSGGFSDGAMRYEGETPGPGGSTSRVKTRLTFFRLGADTVRQLSERPNADGTWSVNYDLIYTRRK